MPSESLPRPPRLKNDANTCALAVEGLSVSFVSTERTVDAVRDVSFDVGLGRDGRDRRRIRLRQIGHRAVDHAPRRARRRPHPGGQARFRAARRHADRPRAGGRRDDARHPRRRDRDDLPGADDLAQSGLHGGRPDRRIDPAASGQGSRRRERRGAADAGAGAHPRSRAGADALSAPALRRHAPARDDRDGAVVPPESADRRRADDRARRDGAGADPGADPDPAGGDADGRRLHHARHGRGRRGRRPRRRDAAAGRRSRKARRSRSFTRRASRIRERCSPRCRGSARCAAPTMPEKFPLVLGGAPEAPELPTRRAKDRTGAPLLKVRGPHHALRRQGRILRARDAPRPRGRKGELRPRGGRNARAGRRIGLRQVDDRPLAAAPRRRRGRQHRVRGPRHRAAARPPRCGRSGATSR